MTPEQFVYWLQGYAELVDEEPDYDQWEMIKDHLSIVLTKVTPQKGAIRPIIEDTRFIC